MNKIYIVLEIMLGTECLQVSKLLSPSIKWLNRDINYKIMDGQPDELFSAEKCTVFNRKWKNYYKNLMKHHFIISKNMVLFHHI